VYALTGRGDVEGQRFERDREEFLRLAPPMPLRTDVRLYPLRDANRALDELRLGRTRGAGVLVAGTSAPGLHCIRRTARPRSFYADGPA
jgi:hypothetical protein